MIRPGFTGSPLDRADALRQDPEGLARAMADPRAGLLVLDDWVPRATAEGRLDWVPLAEAPAGSLIVLLGLEGAAPRFAALPSGAGPARRSNALFEVLATLQPGEAATYAAARSVLDWHQRHRFCANCGSATDVFRAGWGRHCPNCQAQHFPRTDPVVIMVAEHDGRALLGRQASWDAGRYSALAGFLEPGESIEEAVAREIMEEAGVAVSDVRYVASQPWPFPSQLMIACIAQARDDAITMDAHELEDARWFTRAEVQAALAGTPDAPFSAPPPHAIAHSLLSAWVEG